jgi:hypothetical protein
MAVQYEIYANGESRLFDHVRLVTSSRADRLASFRRRRSGSVCPTKGFNSVIPSDFDRILMQRAMRLYWLQFIEPLQINRDQSAIARTHA